MKGKHAIAAARKREREAVEALEAAQRELAEERQARRDAESEVLRLRALEPELERLRSGEHERQSHRETELRDLLAKRTEEVETLKLALDMQGGFVSRMLPHFGYLTLGDVPIDLIDEWSAGFGTTVVLSKDAARKLSPDMRKAYERARGQRDRADGRVSQRGNHSYITEKTS